MSYKSQLKKEKRQLEYGINAIMAQDTYSNEDRAHVQAKSQRLVQIDDEIKNLNNRLENLPSDIGSRPLNKPYTTKRGKRGIEGRSNEPLTRGSDMPTWYERARENKVPMFNDRGTPMEYDPQGFDLNEYWGQRLGFTKGKENAESRWATRALSEDGSSSAQAITPQSWQSRVIAYLYPLQVAGQLGVYSFPMATEIVQVPQLTGTPTPTWIAENGSISLDAGPAFSDLTFTANGGFKDVTLYSIELAQDAYLAENLPDYLASQMAIRLSLARDISMFYGIAGNAGCPGLNAEGVTLRKYAGHIVTTGATPADFSELSIQAEMSEALNAKLTGFATSPQLYHNLARLNASAYAHYWEPPTDVASMWPPVYSTTFPIIETDPGTTVPSLPAQTGGSYTSLYGGPWNYVMFGERLNMTTQVLRERYMGDNGQFGLFAYQRWSVRVAHPTTFTRSYGAITT